MHPKIIEFINDNGDLIDAADWGKLFDIMYAAFESNTWIYSIIEILEEGLPEYKDELEALKVTKYKDKVIEFMQANNIQDLNSTLLLRRLHHSFGLNIDEMRDALATDSRFKVRIQNRYDYQVKLL